jgi:hypothetical protein
MIMVRKPKFFGSSCQIQNQPIGLFNVNSLESVFFRSEFINGEIATVDDVLSIQNLNGTDHIIFVDMAVLHLRSLIIFVNV